MLVLGPVVFKGRDGLLDHTKPHDGAGDLFGAPVPALLRRRVIRSEVPGERCAHLWSGTCVLQEHRRLRSGDQKCRN